jgi:hypothetical protein
MKYDDGIANPLGDEASPLSKTGNFILPVKLGRCALPRVQNKCAVTVFSGLP